MTSSSLARSNDDEMKKKKKNASTDQGENRVRSSLLPPVCFMIFVSMYTLIVGREGAYTLTCANAVMCEARLGTMRAGEHRASNNRTSAFVSKPELT